MASTAYNPAANSLAEAFNKIIIKLLKKFIHRTSETGMRSLVNVFGPSNHSSDLDRQYTFFPGIRVRSSHPVGNPDAVIASRSSD